MPDPEPPTPAPRVVPAGWGPGGAWLFSLGVHLALAGLLGGIFVSRAIGPRPVSGPPDLEERPEPATGLVDEAAPGALAEPGLTLPSVQQGLALGLFAAPAVSAPSLVPRGPSLQAIGTLQPGRGSALAGSSTGGGRRGSGSVLGMNIFAKRLGVLLDISGSMLESLPAVIDQIDSSFNDYILILVNGCWVINPGESTAFVRYQQAELHGEAAILFLNPGAHELLRRISRPAYFNSQADAGQALLAMAERMNVDSIYWFADFQDTVQPRLMAEAADRLRARGVRLYVQSIDARPHPSILAAVSRTGGSSQIRPK